MSNKYYIQVIDRLIYSGLNLEEAIDLLAKFIAENDIYKERFKNNDVKGLS